MSINAYYAGRLFSALRRMLTFRYLVFFVCISLTACSLFWKQSPSDIDFPLAHDDLLQDALQNIGEDARFAEVYRKKEKLPRGLKYILFYTNRDYAPFSFYSTGQRTFIENKCEVINCYVTPARNFFGDDDISKFDVVAFNGRNINGIQLLNEKRSPNQIYMYVNSESSDYYPLCNPYYDGFFNWTYTYRLDSDIPLLYIKFKNQNGEVGPRKNMNWLELDNSDIDDELAFRVQNRSKAAAWLVSNCKSLSGRAEVVKELQAALNAYGMKIDIYGDCGTLVCPKKHHVECMEMIRRDYFFYLSLENSFAEDYVTEKLLTALKYDMIPIVYGGANYSRFLPPSSYLDIRQFTIKELAYIMYNLTTTPSLYRKFFSWKKEYKYYDPYRENICALCAAVNNKTMLESQTTYRKFRDWWNPTYRNACRKKNRIL